MNKIGGIAKIVGVLYAFPADHGFGLIVVDGQTILVKFNCPMESMPPRGDGIVVASTGIDLQLINGKLKFNGTDVHIGSKYEK